MSERNTERDDDEQPQRSKAERAMAWAVMVQQIERGEQVIAEYIALGISGTRNDIENRAIVKEWRRLAKRLRP